MAQAPSDRIRVLIAEIIGMFRDLLRSALAEECDIVGEAEDGETALALALRTKPHVILLDIIMPGMAVSAWPMNSRAKCPAPRLLCSANTTTKSM